MHHDDPCQFYPKFTCRQYFDTSNRLLSRMLSPCDPHSISLHPCNSVYIEKKLAQKITLLTRLLNPPGLLVVWAQNQTHDAHRSPDRDDHWSKKPSEQTKTNRGIHIRSPFRQYGCGFQLIDYTKHDKPERASWTGVAEFFFIRRDFLCQESLESWLRAWPSKLLIPVSLYVLTQKQAMAWVLALLLQPQEHGNDTTHWQSFRRIVVKLADMIQALQLHICWILKSMSNIFFATSSIPFLNSLHAMDNSKKLEMIRATIPKNTKDRTGDGPVFAWQERAAGDCRLWLSLGGFFFFVRAVSGVVPL